MKRAHSSSPARRGGARQWWLDRSVGVKGMIVVTVPLLALILIALASIVLQNNEAERHSAAERAGPPGRRPAYHEA